MVNGKCCTRHGDAKVGPTALGLRDQRRGGYAPTIARLPRAWNNPAHKKARRLGPLAVVEGVAGLVASFVPPPARPVLPVIPDDVPDDLITGDDDTFPWN